MDKVKMAIQSKGRLSELSLNYLRELGIMVRPSANRELILKSEESGVEVILVRDDDIPQYVYRGAADFGIVGENELLENQYPISVLKRLDFAKCKLVIAVPKNSQIKKLSDLEGERIATSYPNILRKFLRDNELHSSIIKVAGSVETTPSLNLADAIFDITQSGQTIEENNLEILYEVIKSQAVLIENPFINVKNNILDRIRNG